MQRDGIVPAYKQRRQRSVIRQAVQVGSGISRASVLAALDAAKRRTVADVQAVMAAPPASGVFIGVTVQPDGRVAIKMWRDGKTNAVYAGCSVAEALQRKLPQALAEAVEMAQADGSNVTV